MEAERLWWVGASWIGYFLIHSLLAATAVKTHVGSVWPRAMPAYRLVYNGIALILLPIPLWLAATDPGPYLWRWSGWLGWGAQFLDAVAILGFLWSLRYYPLGEFLGSAQWRDRRGPDAGAGGLRISPMHRFVRHPWYFFGLALLWTQDMNPAWLLSAGLATAYLMVGSRLEEGKLTERYGEAYRLYRKQVPGLLPLPWRRLSREQAAALERAAAEEKNLPLGV